MIGTLTVAEATERLRAQGLHISAETLRRGLEQGVYPFGEHIQGRTGGNVYYIYERLFEDWVQARTL